jgi:hypothetical protein
VAIFLTCASNSAGCTGFPMTWGATTVTTGNFDRQHGNFKQPFWTSVVSLVIVQALCQTQVDAACVGFRLRGAAQRQGARPFSCVPCSHPVG